MNYPFTREEFTKIYKEKTYDEMCEMWKVNYDFIVARAKELGLSKKKGRRKKMNGWPEDNMGSKEE